MKKHLPGDKTFVKFQEKKRVLRINEKKQQKDFARFYS